MSWTEREFQSAMRKAGWKNHGQGCHIHKTTKAKFYAWTVTKWRIEKYGKGQAWYPFALAGELPTDAPF